MGAKNDTYDWPGPVMKNKLETSRSSLGASGRERKRLVQVVWRIGTLLSRRGRHVQGEREAPCESRGARLGQVVARTPGVS